MLSRSFFAIAAVAVSSIALSQGGGTSPIVTDKPRDRVLVAPPAVRDNTFRFSPQIREVTGQFRTEEVDNKFNFLVHETTERNTVALGSMTSTPSPILPGAKFPAIGATGWVPPDPDVAIGPNHIVATVNVAIAFFRKDGTKLFEQDLGKNGFFSGMDVTDFVFDPKCFYDSISQRFFVVGLEMDDAGKQSKLLIAVSDDADPTGNWFKYRVEAKQTVNGTDFWLDYPGFGFNKDAIMITGNMFGFTGGFNGIQYIVIPKAPLLTGAQPTISYFSLGGGSAQVMRTPDSGVNVLYAVNWTGLSTAMVHAIENVLTTPTLTTRPVAIPTFIRPTNGATSTGGHELDSLDGRLLNCQVRFGNLYTAHTVRMSNSDPTNASRWYEIRLNGWPASGQNPVLAQSGNVAIGNDTHMFMPAVAVNSQRDIAMVYTRSSPNVVADFVASSRRAGDAPGTMGTPVLLTGSIGSTYGGVSNRWGDYFGCQVDPVDDTTFWGIGMIANAGGGWQTVVQSFKVTTPFASPATSVAKYEGGTSSGTLASILNSDNQYFNVASVPIARTGQVASAVVTFTAPTNNLATLRFTAEAAAANYVTGSYFIWDWTTSKWTYIGATPLTGTDKVISFGASAPLGRYLNAQRQVKVLFRSIFPYSTVRNAVPYTLRLDQLKMSGQF